MQTKRSSLLFFLLFLLIVISSTCLAQPVDPLIKTGRDYMNLFQYDKAFENFKKATDIDPDNWEANFNAGKALIKLKRLDEAEKYLSKALKLNPTEIDIQKALGAIYLNTAKVAQTNGQTARKIEYQLKACHAYPAATKIWLSIFEQWWDNNEYKKIKEEGDFLYKNNSTLLEEGEDKSLQQALVMVAKAYYNDAEYNKAETFLNYASKIRNSNEELYGLKRQIKNQAEEKVKKIIEQAENEISKKQYQKAIETLKIASKAAVTNQSEIENKIENLEKQIQLEKFLEEINQLIGKKDYENAYTKLDEALQIFPENETLIKLNDDVVGALEEIQDAKDRAEKAKQRREDEKRQREDSIKKYKNEAKKYEKEQLYDEAINSLTEAQKLNPSDVEIKNKLEELKIAKQKAIERNKQYIREQSTMQDYFDAKDYENCAKTGEELLVKFPENKETISSLLAESYLMLQKYDEAAKAVIPLEDKDQFKDLYNFCKGLNAYKNGIEEDAKKYLELVKKGTSKYQKEASKTLTIMFLTSWKAITGICCALLTVIILIFPKVNEYIKHSSRTSMNAKLEKIKESGNYEANYNFLKQRYEKEDADNMKLVMLLYAAALQKKGENDLAYKIISDYLKRDSRSPLARNIAGETAMALGINTPIALEQIQGLLKLNENRKDVVEYLAKTYIAQKADHKLAQEYISKYVAFNTNDTEALTYLADVYFSRQNYTQQSVKTFEKAVKACPDKAEYYVALMENYKSIGNLEEANKLMETINEKFPDYYGSNSSQQQNYDSFNYGQQPSYDYNQQIAAQQPNYDYNQQIAAQQQIFAQQQQTTDQFMDNLQANYNQNQQADANYNAPNANPSAYYPAFGQTAQTPQVPQTSSPASRGSSYYPDYDSIGGNELPSIDALNSSLSSNDGGMPNFGELIQPNKDIVTQEPQQQANTPNIMGPKKNCPHCGAVNPAGEYYCNSCGKPF